MHIKATRTKETKNAVLNVNIRARDMDVCILKGTPVLVTIITLTTKHSKRLRYEATAFLADGVKWTFDIIRGEVRHLN